MYLCKMRIYQPLKYINDVIMTLFLCNVFENLNSASSQKGLSNNPAN